MDLFQCFSKPTNNRKVSESVKIPGTVQQMYGRISFLYVTYVTEHTERNKRPAVA